MQYVKVASFQPVVDHVVRSISTALASGQQVLWLVSGGSMIGVAVEAAKKLDRTENLLVMQVDERYGAPGHSASNWQQLREAGFESLIPQYRQVLLGEDIIATTESYNQAVQAALVEYDYCIGLFGIGTDGHTAGILPGSSAVKSNELVAYFDGFDYKRITITPVAIKKLDLAIAYASGEAKIEALETLQQDLSISVQPAQALKTAKETWIYNDYTGEAI